MIFALDQHQEEDENEEVLVSILTTIEYMRSFQSSGLMLMFNMPWTSFINLEIDVYEFNGHRVQVFNDDASKYTSEIGINLLNYSLSDTIFVFLKECIYIMSLLEMVNK